MNLPRVVQFQIVPETEHMFQTKYVLLEDGSLWFKSRKMQKWERVCTPGEKDVDSHV